MTHPGGPAGSGPGGGAGTGPGRDRRNRPSPVRPPKFRPPVEPTLINWFMDAARTAGAAFVDVARLFDGRPA